MATTPTNKIRHKPGDRDSRVSYFNYNLYLGGTTAGYLLDINNCNIFVETPVYFCYTNYKGPAALFPNIYSDGLMQTSGVTFKEFEGRTITRLEGTPNYTKCFEVSDVIEIDDVHAYKSVKLYDKYAEGKLLLEFTLQDSKIVQIERDINDGNYITFRFGEKPQTPTTLTFLSHVSNVQTTNGKKIGVIYMEGNNKTLNPYVKLDIQSDFIKNNVNQFIVKGYKDTFTGIRETMTFDLKSNEGLKLPFVYEPYTKMSNFILNSDFSFKQLTLDQFADDKVTVTKTTSGTATMTFDTIDYLRDKVTFYTSSGVVVSIILSNNFNIVNNILPIQWNMYYDQTNSKYSIGKLKLQRFSTDITGSNTLTIYLDHQPGVKYSVEEIKSKFGENSQYDVLELVDTSKQITVSFPKNTGIPGFHSGQSIMTQNSKIVDLVKVTTISISAAKFKTFYYHICIAWFGTNNKCDPAAMVYQISDKLDDSSKARDPTLLNTIINSIDFQADLKGIKIEYYVIDTAYTTFGWNIPIFDCTNTKLQDAYSKELYIKSSDKNHVKFGINELNKFTNNTYLTNLNFYDKTQYSGFQNIQGQVTYEHSVFDFANPPIFPATTVFEFDVLDFILLYAIDKSLNFTAIKRFNIGQAEIKLDQVEPLEFAGLTYGTQTILAIRSDPIESYEPMRMDITASKITMTVDYSNSLRFENLNNYRLSIAYRGPENLENPVKFEVTNFNGYAELICGDHGWPDSFRNTEIIKLNPYATTVPIKLLRNTTGPLITTGKYQITNELASTIKSSQLNLKLSNNISFLPDVVFPDLSFDALYLDDHTTRLGGCKAIFENLEIRFNTIAEFDALQVNGNLTVLPGAQIKQIEHSSAKRNGKAIVSNICDIFGKYTTIKWNSDSWPLIILSKDCPQQTGTTEFKFSYDDTILVKTFNTSNFYNNYMGANQRAFIENFKPSEGTLKNLRKPDIWIPPANPSKNWKTYQPQMTVDYIGVTGTFSLKVTDEYNKEHKEQMRDIKPDPDFTPLAEEEFGVIMGNKGKGNGLVIIIVVSLIVLIIAGGIWLGMFFKYNKTLVPLSSSGYSYSISYSWLKKNRKHSDYSYSV
ncbi:hypothetical protein TVAG_237910 [Trichomonas vaginalis G3]|uniref:Uncharacterized protein n=1 Tax=Trichomonas vaginalis (strain ATCC PRA-98 / G3) TaxID=412133 RepID=A2DCZ1_TRIV3|nr:hypothetical protein TVAGG3_0606290 [Trichomonas vaginalis G3]EAY21765.1 hypothetical protein TVAG_237910 [Trichomonas vaginalis G3]KAI5524263.1 hypothetical protein TVAGG3_0606290 [Trichomonas vaginalis G3]|eukprot:XP_001582751.1 hypothetical protein [Trichomonas vaginalis G3]